MPIRNPMSAPMANGSTRENATRESAAPPSMETNTSTL